MIWLSLCTSRDAGRQGFAFLEDFLLRTRSEDLGELNTVDGCRTRVESTFGDAKIKRRELEKTGVWRGSVPPGDASEFRSV